MKILIISGVPIRTDTNSGKTLLNLFSAFQKEELCQLYFSPETPNINLCNSYYQLCEKQMISSCFGLFSNRCGGEVSPSLFKKHQQTPQKNPVFFIKSKRSIFIRIIREWLWSITHWKNKKLKDWLKSQNPDIIFAIMQDTNGSIKAITWIAKFLEKKVVLYTTDDYYYDPYSSVNIIRKIYFANRQHFYQKLAKHTSSIIGCSETITTHFAKKLKIPKSFSLFTPSAETYFDMPEHPQKNNHLLYFRYFGNLGLGRWQILRQLGLSLQKINEHMPCAILEVYSSDKNPKTAKMLTIDNGSVYKGWVYGEEYLELLQSADVAVHVESFEPTNLNRTWGSISTKIADYLGAGKCIFAIGPLEQASINQIKNVAFIVDDLHNLENTLKKIIDDPNLRSSAQKKAKALAKSEHDICIIQKKLRDILATFVH